jgi:ATP-dependent DNA ligase
VCGPDAIAIFDALHRRGTVTEAMLFASDLLELDADYRPLPLRERKARLDRLVDRRLAGIAMVDHTDGRELVFEQACKDGPWRASCRSGSQSRINRAGPGAG